MHNAHLLQQHHGGGGLVTTALVAMAGMFIGYLLDGHPYTRRLSPLVQTGIERFHRHQQQRSQAEFTFEDPSDHQQPEQQPQKPSPQETTTTSLVANSIPQTTYDCPLSGDSFNFHLPPNTPHALTFVAISLALYTLVHHCTILRPRRDLTFLLQLQLQLQSQTTSVSTAARHCKTSEKAIRDWLHHYDQFANGPASSGPDN
jgi:hypothetical protein